MNKNIACLLIGAVLLGGCSSNSVGPISAGKNSYVISKQSASFTSDEKDLLTSVFTEANDLCRKQKRTLKIEQLNEYTGYWWSENKATLIFSCIKEKALPAKPVKVTKPTKVTKPVTKQAFPKNSKLTHYVM